MAEEFSYQVTTKEGKNITRTVKKSSGGKRRTIKDSDGDTLQDYGGGFRTKVSGSGEVKIDTTGVQAAKAREKERVESTVRNEDLRSSVQSREVQSAERARVIASIRSRQTNNNTTSQKDISLGNKIQRRLESARRKNLAAKERARITNLREGGGAFDSTRAFTSTLEREGRGFAQAAFFTPATVIANPTRTFRGLKQAFLNPRSTFINIRNQLGTTGGRLRTGEYTLGQVAGDIALSKGIGRGFRIARSGVETATTVLDPRFKPFNKGTLPVKTTKGSVTIKRAEGVASTSESLSVQARRSGTVNNPVSASTGLFGTFRRRVIVDKPLPSPDSPPLEKAFFADPAGRLRTSRLGVTSESRAGLLDYVTGNYRVGSSKPQAILFPKERIAKLPKDIQQTLVSGRQLSRSQAQRLEQLQLTPTGEFKAPGFLSKESEVVLAPGEIIIKTGTPRVTLVNGRRVPIIEARVLTGDAANAVADSAARLSTLSSPSNKFISRSNAISRIGFSSVSSLSNNNVSIVSPSKIQSSDNSFNVSRPSGKKSVFSKSLSTTDSSFIFRSGRSANSITSSSKTFSFTGSSSTPTGESSRISRASSLGLSSSLGSSPSKSSSLFSGSSVTRTPTQTIYTPYTPVLNSKRDTRSFFTVQTLQKGKFVNIGRASSKEKATSIGVRAVGSTALRTFRVLKRGKVQRVNAGSLFRRSKTRKGGVVERSKIAINTAGELKEISPKKKRVKTGGFKIL